MKIYVSLKITTEDFIKRNTIMILEKLEILVFKKRSLQ